MRSALPSRMAACRRRSRSSGCPVGLRTKASSSRLRPHPPEVAWPTLSGRARFPAAKRRGNRQMRPMPELRSAYRHFRVITTRWMDNDVYGHVNNVQYYSFFDTVVNGYLIAEGVLDPQASAADDRRVVTKANDFWGLTCPDKIKDDLRV